MDRRPGVTARSVLVLATVLAALAALGPAAESAGAIKFTFIGDSKAAGIEFSPAAKRLLARGHDVRRDLEVCRRLVARSCVYRRVRPLTALEAVRFYGTSLGTVLVVDVGYNDKSATYRGQMEMVITAATVGGVRGIVWVNLRAVRPELRKINAIIAQVASRQPIVRVANWNRFTRNKPATWFGDDDIHLTGAGAVGLVRLVRKHVPLAAQAASVTTVSQPDGAAEQPPTPTAEDEAELTASSRPVGPNIGGPNGGSSAISGLLPFAAGAALMLFLILVTVKRRPGRLDPS